MESKACGDCGGGKMSGKKQIKILILLRPLFKKLCKHLKEYDAGDEYHLQGTDFNWHNCQDCILREISWEIPQSDGMIRDLCFAIWHEGILD